MIYYCEPLFYRYNSQSDAVMDHYTARNDFVIDVKQKWYKSQYIFATANSNKSSNGSSHTYTYVRVRVREIKRHEKYVCPARTNNIYIYIYIYSTLLYCHLWAINTSHSKIKRNPNHDFDHTVKSNDVGNMYFQPGQKSLYYSKPHY